MDEHAKPRLAPPLQSLFLLRGSRLGDVPAGHERAAPRGHKHYKRSETISWWDFPLRIGPAKLPEITERGCILTPTPGPISRRRGRSGLQKPQEEYHLFADVYRFSHEAPVLPGDLKATLTKEEKQMRIGVIAHREL